MAVVAGTGGSIQLTPHLTLLVGYNDRFPTIPYCNSLLIAGEETVLVDTCAGSSLQTLAESGRVDRIVHTHVHPDHVNHNRLFPGVPVWAPAMSAHVLASVEAFLDWSGFAALGPLVGGWCAGQLGFCPWPVAGTFGHGDLLDFGPCRLRALHAPGHCMDHFVLHDEDNGIVFATDIDLTPFGPWYGNPHSDIDAFLDSIELVISLRPRVLVSSHMDGVVTGDIAGQLRQYAAVIGARDERIVGLLRPGLALEQLLDTRPVFRRYPPEAAVPLRQFERVMVSKHLERLVARGRVRREGDRYAAV